MPKIIIDQDKCNHCGSCVALCNSGNVYVQKNDTVQVVSIENCWFCGHCVAVCPTDAIDHSQFLLDDCPPIEQAILPSLENMVEAFRERRSTRIYKIKPVARKIIQALIEIAEYVPSADNAQPVDWLAFDDPDLIEELSQQTITVFEEKLDQGRKDMTATVEDIQDFERLIRQKAQGLDPIFFKAPVLLMAHVPVEDSFGRDDATYAAYNLILAAQRMGLGSCLIGYFIYALENSDQLRRYLRLPDNRRVEVALVIGYPKYQFKRIVSRRAMEIIWNPVPSK
ncbi:MAG: nitroreductase family protein [Deltaproteobacteria bacterium]|nr:nitroreductase family protein [Deltaproteobacteria bacterium]